MNPLSDLAYSDLILPSTATMKECDFDEAMDEIQGIQKYETKLAAGDDGDNGLLMLVVVGILIIAGLAVLVVLITRQTQKLSFHPAQPEAPSDVPSADQPDEQQKL